LFGQPVDENRIYSLEKKVGGFKKKYFRQDDAFETSGRQKLLERLLDQSVILTPRQIEKGLAKCFGEDGDNDGDASRFPGFVKDFEKCMASLKEENW
jgi:hypothetical protein